MQDQSPAPLAKSSTKKTTSPAAKTPPSPPPPTKSGFSVSLRALAGLLIIGAGAAFVFYKYSGNQVVADTSNLHQELLVTELNTLHENIKLSNEIQELFEGESEDEDDFSTYDNIYLESETTDEVIEAFSEIEAKTQLIIDAQVDYIVMLEGHRTQYQEMHDRAKLVQGSDKEFIEEFFTVQDEYYEAEIADSTRALTEMRLNYEFILTSRDLIIFSLYMYNTDGLYDEEVVYNSFGELAPLERYTRNDFEYEYADDFEEVSPYGYESLEKINDFLGTFYSAVKSVASGDYDSALYKLTRLEEDALAVDSVDFDRIEKETRREAKKVKKDLVQALVERATLLEDQSLEKGTWAQNEGLCHLYLYKLDLYYTANDEFPESEDRDGILDDLSDVSPKTESFDETSGEVIDLEADDDALTLTCSEQTEGSYEFELSKVDSDSD